MDSLISDKPRRRMKLLWCAAAGYASVEFAIATSTEGQEGPSTSH